MTCFGRPLVFSCPRILLAQKPRQASAIDRSYQIRVKGSLRLLFGSRESLRSLRESGRKGKALDLPTLGSDQPDPVSLPVRLEAPGKLGPSRLPCGGAGTVAGAGRRLHPQGRPQRKEQPIELRYAGLRGYKGLQARLKRCGAQGAQEAGSWSAPNDNAGIATRRR